MKLIHGDCLEEMPMLEANSVDSIVTDPPYGLKFMGKNWDHGVPGEPFWREALRVAKPGAHLLAFGGTRTFHHLAVAIEDAGWEIRDTIVWVYGSGFPKSHNVSKAIDKMAGAEREVVGQRQDIIEKQGADIRNGKRKIAESLNSGAPERDNGFKTVSADITAPAIDEAKQWDGWGTALKPAAEMIVVARKPLSEKTIASNVLKHGTGAINVDACRVEADKGDDYGRSAKNSNGTVNAHNGFDGKSFKIKERDKDYTSMKGRFPANLIHDGSEEVLQLFPNTGKSTGGKGEATKGDGENLYSGYASRENASLGGFGDSGSAARYFYCAKASKRDRDEGLSKGEHSNHPTIKPTDLMRYLCRLVTPPGGTVLDPFMGSGSTGKAAKMEGFDFIGIEYTEEYMPTAEKRINVVMEGVK